MTQLLKNNNQRLILIAALIAVIGCQDKSIIELVPVFPADEPNLLSEIEWEIIKIDAIPADTSGQSVVSTVLLRGDRLNIENLSEGWWTLQFRATSAEGVELLRGNTLPFEIKLRTSRLVKLFIGRSSSFNLVTLEPADLADELSQLTEHSATVVTLSDQSRRIIVAGGKSKNSPIVMQSIYSINPGTFEIEKLDAKMNCPRTEHEGILLNTAKGQRIVFAGGETTNCERGLDVLDPATGEISFVELGCDLKFTDGSVAEITVSDDGSRVTTGNIIVPGRSACVIDVLGSHEPYARLLSPELQAPFKSAVSNSGALLLVDAEGRVLVDSVNEGALGKCNKNEHAVWQGLDPLKNVKLVPMSKGDHFLWIGLSKDTLANNTDNWAFISIENCNITDVQEGSFKEESLSEGIETLNLSFDSTNTEEEFLLITGGKGASEGKTVSLFYKSMFNSKPLPLAFDNLPTSIDIQMRNVRAGHTFVSVSDDTIWALGGGNDLAEIFLIGNMQRFKIEKTPFSYRKPSLLSVTVYDSNSMVDLSDVSNFTLGINEFIFSTVTSGTHRAPVGQELSAVVSRVSTANRGIAADELGANIVNIAEGNTCENVPVEDATIFESTALGDLNGEFILGFDPMESFNDAVIKVHNDVSNLGGVSVYFSNLHPEPSNVHQIFWSNKNECSWRQPVRVGFDGLGLSTEDGSYAGIKLLVWIAENDDCSQGIYSEKTVAPSLEAMSNHSCTEDLDEWEDYFQIPPEYGSTWATQFENKVKDLIWNPQDLLVLMISGHDAETCDTNPNLRAPRRLSKVVQLLENKGAEIKTINICGSIEDDKIETAKEWLGDQIVNRNPVLACVPTSIDTTPYEPRIFSDVGPDVDGLFEVMHHDETLLSNLSKQINDNCKVLRVSQIDTDRWEAGDTVHANVSHVQMGSNGWTMATDYDKRAGCVDGLVVKMDQGDLNYRDESTAYVVCIDQ